MRPSDPGTCKTESRYRPEVTAVDATSEQTAFVYTTYIQEIPGACGRA